MAARYRGSMWRDGNLHQHKGGTWVDGPYHDGPHTIIRAHKNMTEEGRELHKTHREEWREEKANKEQAITAEYPGSCVRCVARIMPGDEVWWDPGTKATRHRGTDCDSSGWDGDAKKDSTPKDSPPKASSKASKEDFQMFAEQMEVMEKKVRVAEETSEAAEAAAEKAEKRVEKAEALIEKARRIEIVRTLPSGAKKIRKLGPQHHMFERLLNKVQHGINVAMVGDAGSGKTRAPREVAKALKLPFYLIPLGPMTSKSDLLGFINGSGKYVYSLLCRAYEYGGVVLLDEMDAANPAGLTICNGLLDSVEAGFADKMRERHKDCHFIAAMNTWGRGADAQFVGRAQLDAATLNRWYYMNWDTDWDLANALVQNKKWVNLVQALSESAARQKVRVQIGMRTAIMGNEALKSGDTIEEAEHAMIWAPMKPDDKQKILVGLDKKEDSNVIDEYA